MRSFSIARINISFSPLTVLPPAIFGSTPVEGVTSAVFLPPTSLQCSLGHCCIHYSNKFSRSYARSPSLSFASTTSLFVPKRDDECTIYDWLQCSPWVIFTACNEQLLFFDVKNNIPLCSRSISSIANCGCLRFWALPGTALFLPRRRASYSLQELRSLDSYHGNIYLAALFSVRSSASLRRQIEFETCFQRHS